MIFPSIRPPSSIKSQKAFTTISTNFEGGYRQTRERHTRDLTVFTVTWASLPREQKDQIVNHFSTVRGSKIFSWTNVSEGTIHSVRYTEFPSIEANAQTPNRFDISLKMEEV